MTIQDYMNTPQFRAAEDEARAAIEQADRDVARLWAVLNAAMEKRQKTIAGLADVFAKAAKCAGCRR